MQKKKSEKNQKEGEKYVNFFLINQSKLNEVNENFSLIMVCTIHLKSSSFDESFPVV